MTTPSCAWRQKWIRGPPFHSRVLVAGAPSPASSAHPKAGLHSAAGDLHLHGGAVDGQDLLRRVGEVPSEGIQHGQRETSGGLHITSRPEKTHTSKQVRLLRLPLPIT
jgi:hypothetical protein